MNDEERRQHQRRKEAYCTALEMEPEQRETFLEKIGSSDPTLRAEVESLLSHRKSDFLEPVISTGSLSAGDKLSEYEIIELIGFGGMGEVYRARGGKLGHEVAIKVLPSFFASDAGRLFRFYQEARAIGDLNHPNILKIDHASQQAGMPYLVMELLEGQTLRAHLEKGPIPTATAVDLAIQIARGLVAAHEKHLVHRDLKPENIFLTQDGQVKVLDFGLAKLIEEESELASPDETEFKTKSGMLLGTVGYMSPEQAGGRKADQRSDIFSFGAILHEMLAGKRAFQGESDAETLDAIQSSEPPEMIVPGGAIPAELQHIARQCLEKYPGKRFQTASDLVIALEDFVKPPPEPSPAHAESEIEPHLDETVDVYIAPERGTFRSLTIYLHSKTSLIVKVTLLMVLAVAGYIGWKQWPWLPVKTRLAVLPLENLSGDAAQIPFAQGMTQELTAELGLLNPKELGVIAHSTAAKYVGKSISQIHSELNVDYVVEGSVLRDSNQVRITVELIQTRDETNLWSKSYEEDMKDVLGLQHRVASAIAQEIDVKLNASATHQGMHPEVDPEAYYAFLTGRYFWDKRGPDAVQRSIQYFQVAIHKDPNYARPYAGMADAFSLLGSVQSGAMPPDVAFPRAREAALKSIQLDAALAEPHASLGYIKLVYERDPEGAKQEFLRALELDPNYVTAHQWLGQYYLVTGNVSAAIVSVQQAYDREPASLAVNIALAEAYYFDRNFDRAIEQSQKALELDPNSALAHFNLGRAYEMKNMHVQALAEFEAAHHLSPSPVTLVPIGYVHARAGETSSTNQALAELTLASRTRYVPALYFAMIYTGMNDLNQAFAALERAKAEHCDYIGFLRLDPMADPLRHDPRFEKVLQKE